MPNELNFKEDIAMFLKFWENPLGIIAVSFVFCFYIIFVLMARHKDIRDKLKVNIQLFNIVTNYSFSRE